MKTAQNATGNQYGGSRPIPTPTEVGDFNDDGTKLQLNEEKMFGLNFEYEEDKV